MLKLDLEQDLIWWLFATLFLYYVWDLVSARRFAWRNKNHPLVGSHWWTSRAVLNFFFAAQASGLIQRGYQKFKTRAFQLIRDEGPIVILPHSTLEELSLLPSSIASPHGALEKDLLGHYTGLDIIIEHRMHHTIVQRKLTPRLPQLAPALQEELNYAFSNQMPAAGEWTDIQPFLDLGQMVAGISSRALVGPKFCRNPVWLDIAVNYTQNLFQTIVVMRMFPEWTHPFISWVVPSYWKGQGYLKTAKALLGPTFEDLIRRNDKGTWSPDNTEKDFNVLSWMVEAAKGRDRNPDTLAHGEVLLALASVHTILIRVVNVMNDLIEHPEYIDELRSEISHVEETVGWANPVNAYAQLYKLDSVIRESQRLSPPTLLGLKRVFKQDYTFSSGVTVLQGTYVALPVMAIENDPENTLDPEGYDGYRSYRKLKAAKDSQQKGSEYEFTSIDKTTLNFGYGRTACPGRYFAGLTIKMMMVKLLTEYDWRFKEGSARPKNHLVHEFLFPWPWDKVEVRRREKPACPF